jgi:hypothetical protein
MGILAGGRRGHGRDLLQGWHGVVTLAGRGVVRVAMGDLERGVADMLDADRRMSSAGLQLSVLTDWVAAATRTLVHLGRQADAQEIAVRELEQAIAFGAARRHGIVCRCAGASIPGMTPLFLCAGRSRSWSARRPGLSTPAHS